MAQSLPLAADAADPVERLAFTIAVRELERRRKIADAHRGKTTSPEIRQKLRESNLGQKRSEAQRENMRRAQQARRQRERLARAAAAHASDSTVAQRETELPEMPQRPSEAAARA